jgi:hypothetical protein
VVFEIGGPDGSLTFVALADNTTSMYTSKGGGIIGAGGHQLVAEANRRLLDVAEAHLADIPPAEDTASPGDGRWIIRVLTDSGPRAVDVSEQDLKRGHPVSGRVPRRTRTHHATSDS